MITIIINLTKCIGYSCRADRNPYRHDRRADKNSYRPDRRADKNLYRHDHRADSQCPKCPSSLGILCDPTASTGDATALLQRCLR